ncbi:hypothetical protein [Dactylosporangium darangshiense]|uniref:Uncharacterized protein n=1 Tax=Dactylosporangium darangshiense TaxID=579108 RepID=A0ABP8DFG3_9ACTN
MSTTRPSSPPRTSIRGIWREVQDTYTALTGLFDAAAAATEPVLIRKS